MYKEIVNKFRWIGVYAGSIQRNLQLETIQRQIAMGRHPNKCKCVALHLISISNVAQAPGQALVPTIPGIMGPSIRSLQLVFKSLLSTKPWRKDASVVPMPWRDDLEKLGVGSNLAIGPLEDDGVVVPQPLMARALQTAANAMKKARHRVRKIAQFRIAKTCTILDSVLGAAVSYDLLKDPRRSTIACNGKTTDGLRRNQS